MSSNGWGLGHLSREVAIALAIADSAEVTMFSFSRGLPLVSRFGIRGEYCPGHTTSWIPHERWNSYVERRFQLFLSEVKPDVVLFDGVAPYPGILNALLDQPAISAGWLRRGMWLKGRTEVQLTKSELFDFVIEPGDIASAADHGPTSRLESTRVPPVSLLEVVPTLERAEAAAELGLAPDRPTLLFALGSGHPGDAVSARDIALEQSLRHHDWQVALVSSPLSDGVAVTSEEVVHLRGVYPLISYLSAFDAAVSAAGYNSVHELVPAGVPTLFVPKSASQTDDQVARATFLAEQGLSLIAPDDDFENMRKQVDNLLGEGGRQISQSVARTDRAAMLGGAGAVGKLLISDPPVGVRASGREEWRQPGLKGFVKRTIGPTGVEYVQRVLGRTPPRPLRLPVTLEPDSRDGVVRLLISDTMGDVAQAPDVPVEHLLEGTSGDYRNARHDLVAEFYDVV